MEAWDQRLYGDTPSSSVLSVDRERDLPPSPAYNLKPGLPAPGSSTLLRPPIATTGGTGILTRFPSTTPFGLALGTDYPYADYLYVGNLGFSVTRFLTLFFATHVSIISCDTSSRPHGRPSQAYTMLPYHLTLKDQIRSFGTTLSPVTFSAQTHSTSELLRFL